MTLTVDRRGLGRMTETVGRRVSAVDFAARRRSSDDSGVYDAFVASSVSAGGSVPRTSVVGGRPVSSSSSYSLVENGSEHERKKHDAVGTGQNGYITGPGPRKKSRRV